MELQRNQTPNSRRFLSPSLAIGALLVTYYPTSALADECTEGEFETSDATADAFPTPGGGSEDWTNIVEIYDALTPVGDVEIDINHNETTGATLMEMHGNFYVNGNWYSGTYVIESDGSEGEGRYDDSGGLSESEFLALAEELGQDAQVCDSGSDECSDCAKDALEGCVEGGAACSLSVFLCATGASQCAAGILVCVQDNGPCDDD